MKNKRIHTFNNKRRRIYDKTSTKMLFNILVPFTFHLFSFFSHSLLFRPIVLLNISRFCCRSRRLNNEHFFFQFTLIRRDATNVIESIPVRRLTFLFIRSKDAHILTQISLSINNSHHQISMNQTDAWRWTLSSGSFVRWEHLNFIEDYFSLKSTFDEMTETKKRRIQASYNYLFMMCSVAFEEKKVISSWEDQTSSSVDIHWFSSRTCSEINSSRGTKGEFIHRMNLPAVSIT